MPGCMQLLPGRPASLLTRGGKAASRRRRAGANLFVIVELLLTAFAAAR
jgi:hypothetical protein